MKKYILLLALAFICCKKNESKIILTSGLDENPSVLRFGIEINNLGDLYFCEEIKPESGKYNYFYSKIEKKDFQDFQFLIQNNFTKSDDKEGNYNVDDKIYNLRTKFPDGEGIDLFIQLNSLKFKQVKIINSLVNLKKRKLKRIRYHNFPKRLLTFKSSIPPVPTSR